MMGLAVARVQFGLPEDYWDTYPDKIMAVTAEDVQRVARKYLDPDAMQLVAVGDGVKIQSVLESYGPVEVYDSNGKLNSSLKP
jgi:predicted Zn-dependent peptidase